jgi:phage terminase large subunit GpA-like protein
MTCSPTLAGSEIDRAYDSSDKQEFFVPCPGCGHEQSMMLRFHTQVRWDAALPTRQEQARSARYHCEACDAAWDDAARWKAIERGEWRAQAPFNGIAGFWISELYSPWKQLSEIVLD